MEHFESDQQSFVFCFDLLLALQCFLRLSDPFLHQLATCRECGFRILGDDGEPAI